MKKLLTLMLGMTVCAATAFAAEWPAACGSDSVQYKVKTSKAAFTGDAPEPGKARVVLIATKDDGLPDPLIRFGVDGTWVGADKGDSYFVTSVAPGAHVLCGSRQSSARSEKENRAVIKMDVQAGNTYYFLFSVKKDVVGFAQRSNGGAGGSATAPGGGSTPNMTARDPDFIEVVDFAPLDEAQAGSRLKKSPLSTFMVK